MFFEDQDLTHLSLYLGSLPLVYIVHFLLQQSHATGVVVVAAVVVMLENVLAFVYVD